MVELEGKDKIIGENIPTSFSRRKNLEGGNVRVVKLGYLVFYLIFLFYFSFNLFLYSELRVRIRVTRSCCHTSVISDNMITVIVTNHGTYRKI